MALCNTPPESSNVICKFIPHLIAYLFSCIHIYISVVYTLGSVLYIYVCGSSRYLLAIRVHVSLILVQYLHLSDAFPVSLLITP